MKTDPTIFVDRFNDLQIEKWYSIELKYMTFEEVFDCIDQQILMPIKYIVLNEFDTEFKITERAPGKATQIIEKVSKLVSLRKQRGEQVAKEIKRQKAIEKYKQMQINKELKEREIERPKPKPYKHFDLTFNNKTHENGVKITNK